MALEMDVDRLPDPALLLGIGHPVPAQQHLLVVEREAGDLPPDCQSLEQHLATASPDVLHRRGVTTGRLAELSDRLRAQGLPEGEDVPVRVGVVDGVDRLPLPALPSLRHNRRMPTSLTRSRSRSTSRSSSGWRSRCSTRALTAISPAV